MSSIVMGSWNTWTISSGLAEEIHRIARPGGRVEVIAPYFTSVDAYTDPTPKRFFSMRSFDYFTGEFPEARPLYLPCFRRTRVELYLAAPTSGRATCRPGAHRLHGGFQRCMSAFFVHILPAQLIRYELEVIKPGATQPSVPFC